MRHLTGSHLKQAMSPVPVLHHALPQTPWADPRQSRLPGTAPVDPESWYTIDEAYDGQMRLRDELISTRPGDVIAELPEAAPAVQELFATAMSRLAADPRFRIDDAAITRPCGARVPLGPGDRLTTLGRLFQEDLCILQKPEGAAEHILSAATLCFPASWTLSEKVGRPLGRIHRPVARYDKDVTARVQRLFDGIKPGRPLWRANAHLQKTPHLFTPEREASKSPPTEDGPYLRSERQVLLRLPETGAILFSIHSYMIRIADLTADQRATLPARWPNLTLSDQAQ